MSFVAQILITKRIIFNWHLWIVVDVIGIWLYWHKGLKLISLLYVVFLSLAIKGLVDWRRKLSAQGEIDHEQALQ
jgi:nicotinamide mononucleotide transporter